MATVLGELAAEAGVNLPQGEHDALGRSLPRWPVFTEVRGALAEARERGWHLVALSNCDRDLIEASLTTIAVPFELAIVASEIGSYKPAYGHWRSFYDSTGADNRGTCTSLRATSTTSCLPMTSAFARSGSTGSARGLNPRPPGSFPTWPVSPMFSTRSCRRE